jgi:polar amino acid transport system substrate-binding protein
MTRFQYFKLNVFKMLSLFVLMALFSLVPILSWADSSRLDRIIQRGELPIGTRERALPFSAMDEAGRFTGFSVDIARMIADGFGAIIGKKISPKFSVVTATNRFSKVLSGDVDLVCGLTTVTLEREKIVDFSLPFFVDGTRILVNAGARRLRLNDLSGKLIGVVANTTTAKIVSKATSGVTFRNFTNLESAMSAFEAGELFGVANIGVTLAAKRSQLGGALTMDLVPQKYSLREEVLACILPPNDSRFRDLVNQVLFQSFEGVEELSGDYSEIYFRWFGVNSQTKFPMTEYHQDLMKSSRIWLE